jgi:enamine deaminase RidA (YjgF/YER057c/UK114 family)
MARLVNPAGLKAQTYYNHAVVKTGFPVFLTGQVAWDAQGAVVGVGDIAAQAAQIWANINLLLSALDAGPEHIVKLVTYALDREFIPALHAARAKIFGAGPYPASTFIIVAGLAVPELLAEIDVTLMLES